MAKRLLAEGAKILSRGLQVLRERQAAADKFETEQRHRRVAKTAAERRPAAVDDLYRRVVLAVKRRYAGRLGGLRLQIDLKTHPHDVVDEVVGRFRRHGWSVKHVFRDYEPVCDYLEISPPADWVDRLLPQVVDDVRKR